jgi:hypothetical protein
MAKTGEPNILVIMGDDIGWFNPSCARGELPGSEWDVTRLTLGGLSPCAACDEPTTGRDAAVECYFAGRRMMMHPDCYVMWDEARQAPGASAAASG